MHGSLSSIPWPIQLEIWTAFLPPLAAAVRRRWSWRDPLAQVAFCWLVMALIGLGQMLAKLNYPLPSWRSAANTTTLFPVLLLPATLGWIGARAQRWALPLVVLWLCVCLGVSGWVDARLFRVVAQPVMAVGMAIASAIALALRVQDSRRSVSREGWFWVLTAHVAYFTTDIVRQPLIEALNTGLPSARVAAHYAFMIVYAFLNVLLAWAMLPRDAQPASMPRSAAAVSPPRRASLSSQDA